MTSFYIGDDVAVVDVGCGDAGVLAVGGEIDYATSSLLRARVLGAIEDGSRHLVLDFSAVTFVDSTAIGVLVGAITKLDEAGGGSLAVVCTHGSVLRIFEITGLDVLIPLYRSLDEAFSALAVAG
jgi:anti-sigma B factor antagonist